MKTNLSSKIEALLFVAGDDGLTLKQLQFLTEAEIEELQAGIIELETRYAESVSGICLKELAGVFQLVTKQEVAETIQKLVENPTVQAL